MATKSVHCGRRLEVILLGLNITKKELSDRLNIAASNISRWLKEPKFQHERIEIICKALNITESQFNGDDEIDMVLDYEAQYLSVPIAENKEIVYLKKLLEEKERLIQVLIKKCD